MALMPASVPLVRLRRDCLMEPAAVEDLVVGALPGNSLSRKPARVMWVLLVGFEVNGD